MPDASDGAIVRGRPSNWRFEARAKELSYEESRQRHAQATEVHGDFARGVLDLSVGWLALISITVARRFADRLTPLAFMTLLQTAGQRR